MLSRQRRQRRHDANPPCDDSAVSILGNRVIRKEDPHILKGAGSYVDSLHLPGIDDLFNGADVVVEQRMVNRRMAPAPMEGRVAAATWDGARLTLYASTQGVSATRDGIVGIFGLDKQAVRVIAADVGGGF